MTWLMVFGSCVFPVSRRLVTYRPSGGKPAGPSGGKLAVPRAVSNESARRSDEAARRNDKTVRSGVPDCLA